MKIEMINEHQIRCTLTREDLESRQIKLSELAYGSDKAKQLFRDMMQQAADDFGFDAEDIPLMIEAIPLSQEAIMLIISKVDAPDELDTRFSNFTHDASGSDVSSDEKPEMPPFTDLSSLISQIHNGKKSSAGRNIDTARPNQPPKPHAGLFSFHDLDDAILLAHQLTGYYHGKSMLFYNEGQQLFHLVLQQGSHSPADFDKVLHMTAKYLTQEQYSLGREAYLKEHDRIVFTDDALTHLGAI